MPSIRNPFENLWLPRQSFGNPTEENVGRLGRLKINPWSPTDLEDDQEVEPGFAKRDWSNYLKDLRDVYSKTGPAQTAYESHLQNLPEQQKPSVWGRIVAGIVGAGTGYTEGPSKGIAAGQSIVRRPYEQALDEWSNKEAALGRQVSFEDKASQRQLDYLKEVGRVTENEADYEKEIAKLGLQREAQAETKRLNDSTIKYRESQGFVRYDDPETKQEMLIHPNGRKILIGPSLKVAEFGERKRAAGVGEKQAGERLQQGWKGLQFEGQRVQQGAEGLGLERRRTAVSEEQLKINQDAEMRRAETAKKGGTARYVPPTQQTEARIAALSRAALENPDFAGYFDHKNGVVKPSTAKRYPDGYKRYMQRVLEIENEMLGRQYGGLSGGLSQDDDEDFEIVRRK